MVTLALHAGTPSGCGRWRTRLTSAMGCRPVWPARRWPALVVRLATRIGLADGQDVEEREVDGEVHTGPWSTSGSGLQPFEGDLAGGSRPRTAPAYSSAIRKWPCPGKLLQQPAWWSRHLASYRVG